MFCASCRDAAVASNAELEEITGEKQSYLKYSQLMVVAKAEVSYRCSSMSLSLSFLWVLSGSETM